MELDKVVFGAALAVLVGCGEAIVPAQDTEAKALKAPQEKVELVEVEAGPFEPPKPWDFLKDGRPENVYTLMYSRDHGVCSKLVKELNKPLKLDFNAGPLARAQTGYPLDYVELFFGTKYSVAPLSGDEKSTKYTEVDIDHDGEKEALYIYMSLGSGENRQILQMLPLGFRINEGENFDKWNSKFKNMMDQVGWYRSEYFEEGIVDFGASATNKNMRRWFHFGQYIDVVEINQKAYILLGGYSKFKKSPSNANGNGAIRPPIPKEQLVRIVVKNPKSPDISAPDNKFEKNKFSVVCEFRPKFINEISENLQEE